MRSGLRHFSAGADVNWFDARIEQGGRSRAAIGGVDFLKLLELLPIPIVASVHGVCLGGGFELALACDYIVAANSAKIGSVEVALGLHPLLGGIQRQVRRAGALRAKEIAMLGGRYDAANLERWGLVNLVVADDALEDATFTIAEELAHGPTVAHAATKRLVHIAVNEGVLAADEAMAEIQQPIWVTELGFSDDEIDGYLASGALVGVSFPAAVTNQSDEANERAEIAYEGSVALTLQP